MSMVENPWAIADRISDQIRAVVNAELQTMRDAKTIDPPQLLAGQLLALMALFQTMPPLAHHPQTLLALQQAVRACLEDMLVSFASEDGRKRA